MIADTTIDTARMDVSISLVVGRSISSHLPSDVYQDWYDMPEGMYCNSQGTMTAAVVMHHGA